MLPGAYRGLASLAALAAMGAFAPLLACAADRYEGFAYARGSDRLVYLEMHWLYAEHGVAQRLVLYECPDGTPFARKHILERASAAAPDFDFLDGRDGHREGVRSLADGREVYVQENRDAPLRSRRLPDRPAAVIDAGFDAFVRAHWNELARGASIRAPFLLPSRLRFLDFRVFDPQTGWSNGRPVLRLRMGPAAWYAFALPSIDLMYDSRDRRLLEFAGPGTIRDSRGRNQDVRIEFPDRTRVSGVPLEQVRSAAAEALTGRCGG